ncbi:MAG: radical SAM family heme chaperone HemW [Ignavibacteria bacterium]
MKRKDEISLKESALYVHIPFCRHKCIYCDFYSVTTKNNIGAFLSAVIKETAFYSQLYSEGRIFTSIFFGGGTPSLMEPEYIGKIISALKDNYTISCDAEITLETNPGTVSRDKLDGFIRQGINRLSIGIQTFHNEELKFLTRIHDRETAITTVHDAKSAGFNNINADLIFSLPGQTSDKWKNNLETVVSLPVTHISAYSLILERGTILNKLVLDGKIKLQDSSCDADIYEMTMDFLGSCGFRQYEVSNYSLDGFECRHNKACWQYRDYLSFGPSAHSFANGKRWWNYSSLKKYISEINLHGVAVADYEILTDEQMLNEYVMLAMRSGGLNITGLKQKFGDDWINKKSRYLQSFEERGFLLISHDTIQLTSKGYALCDEILARIL